MKTSLQTLDTTETAAAKGEFLAPCTLIQKSFLELQARNPQSSIANVAMRWRLAGAIRDKSVQAALKLMAERHEILRTRFERVEGGFRQVVVQPRPSCR